MIAPVPKSLREDRELELVRATRALFDRRGVQDAPIEEIAKAVGIPRALIYRQFSSKEELFVLTVTDYLAELDGLLVEAAARASEPTAQLEHCMEAYTSFCHRYPAFLDSSLALMHRPARDLRGIVSASVWLRLGRGMGRCLDRVAQVLAAGGEAGVFDVVDPDYTANVLWTQVLGLMHLARIQVGVRQTAPDMPKLFSVTPEQVMRTAVVSALATVGAPLDAGAPAGAPAPHV